MIENKMTKIIYALFTGALIAIFVGVGVNTFYLPPESPSYPVELTTYSESGPTKIQTEKQAEYDVASNKYNEDTKVYSRNVSMITLGAAVVLLMVSIIYAQKIKFIADGIMMGGLFTLVYSIGRGLVAQDSQYLFISITVGLAVVLYLGYSRFQKEVKKTKR